MTTQATGPRTDAGKERSSLNAVKHGILPEKPVLPGEDAAEWDKFRTGIVAHFKPVGLYETDLAERIALQMWRLRRVGRLEAAALAAEADADQPESGEQDGRRTARTTALERVVRYEAHLSRQLKQVETMLRAAREERRQREAEMVQQVLRSAAGSSFRTPPAPPAPRPAPPAPPRVKGTPLMAAGVGYCDLAIAGGDGGKQPPRAK